METLLKDLPPDCRHDLVELLAESTSVGTWHWDIERNTFQWSARQFVHFGLQPMPMGGVTYESWLEAIHPEDRERVQAGIADTIASGGELDLTFRVLWRDNGNVGPVDVHWLRSRGRLLRGADGTPLKMVGTSQDVTEDARAQAAAQSARDAVLADRFGGPSRFDLYFESSDNCLVQLKAESDGRFTYQMINAAGLKMIGMTMAAARGLTPTEVMGAENGVKVEQALRSVVETRLPVSFEPTFDYDGQTVIYDATYMPICTDRGEVGAVLCRARDVTEERRTAAAREQAKKMEALGVMAAGVAHDFNNLLTSLRGCFNRLNRLSRSPDVQYLVELGSHSLDQAEAVTRRLVAFARREEIALTQGSLETCVNDTLGVLRSSVPEARITTDLKQTGPVLLDPGLIQACILNLCVNARDAAIGPCVISITTGPATRDQIHAADLPDAAYACVAVRDNGSGMSEETLLRAMEPFFTTKSTNKGTGLGLSMVDGTVKAMAGAVLIDSAPGSGTTVTMLLPSIVSIQPTKAR